MTDLLRKSMAPITDGAWEVIEAQAAQTLKGNLALRSLVDFSGPHGQHLASINTGRLKTGKNSAVDGVTWNLREALPLIDIRTSFRLERAELDAIERGTTNPDLDSLMEAAARIATFEEKALFSGIPDTGIDGMASASSHQPVKVSKKEPTSVFEAILSGILALEKAGINGPYAAVFGDDGYQALRIGQPGGYPVAQRAADVLKGGIRWSPIVSGGLILSRRGGDFEMTSGQDIAIGYQEHDADAVTLYLTESFTFRVIDPAAAIVLSGE